MKVLVVTPGESPREVEIDGSLESMQNIVGGLIQAVYPFDDPVALVCNDEGKLLGLEPNRALRDPNSGAVYDLICGPFFLCGLGLDDFVSLTDELLVKYRKYFESPELFMKLGDQLIVIPI